MAVSTGFLKKIQRWVVDDESGEVLFLPFQAEGNPYKARLLLVGGNPEPLIQVNAPDFHLLAETLVEPTLFGDLFCDEIDEASREYKGSLNFAAWVKENLQEQVVLSSINCLNLEVAELKQLKKEKDPLFLRGFNIFKEVVNEFEPEVLVIQGAAAFKLFMEQFKDQLADFEAEDMMMPVQGLEQKGVIAKLTLDSGLTVNIMVCRSMGAFGKEGKSFGDFKAQLYQLLQ